MIKNKEIISLIKDDVLDTARKIKAHPKYPSEVISYVIWAYSKNLVTEEAILSKNNILGHKTSDGEFVEYSTIQQCLLTHTGEVQPEEFIKEKENICKINKLYNIDKAYAYSMNNAIDLTTDQKRPPINHYTVTNENGEIVGVASTLKDGVELAENTDSKGIITDSMGNVVTTIRNKSLSVENAKSISLEPQATVRLDDVYLYQSSASTIPSRLISGTYCLYDGIIYNGKLAVCKYSSEPLTLGDIIGFIMRSAI